MMFFLSIAIVAFVVTATEAQVCKDVSHVSSCINWRDNYDFCKRSDASRYCKKTCGLCSTGPTQPPTQPPTQQPTIPPGPSSCGKSRVPQSRIINGENAVPGSWPWIASLQKNSGHYCGATLLTPKWILTASHCVERISTSNLYQWTIKLGAHNHRQTESSVQRIAIKRVIMHPSYSRSTLLADMAMIELKTPAQLNSRVGVACLPQRGVYPSLGKQCYLAGWGSISHPGAVYHILQQTRLPVVRSSSCKHQSEVVCVGNGFNNQPNGKQQPNACRGDSGGPLVCQQADGRWQLEGVASYVYTYCKYYTGYSPVNKYLDWIKQYIRR